MSAKKKKHAARRPGAALPLLTQVARSSRTALSRHLLGLDLYAGQDALLQALDRDEGRTPGFLAAQLGVRAPTVTKGITRLAGQGFVRREGALHDRRMSLVFLTDAGHRKIKAIGKAQKQVEKQALSGFKGKEVRQLIELLERLGANLSDIAVSAATSTDEQVVQQGDEQGHVGKGTGLPESADLTGAAE